MAVHHYKVSTAQINHSIYVIWLDIANPAEVGLVASYKPLSEEKLSREGNVVYVGFLGERPGEAAIEKLRASSTGVDEFRVDGREVYWLARRKMESRNFRG